MLSLIISELEVSDVVKIAGMFLLLLGISWTLLAGFPSPEIDPGSSVTALAVLAGAVLIIRGRQRK
jgi:hypothetical protein